MQEEDLGHSQIEAVEWNSTSTFLLLPQNLCHCRWILRISIGNSPGPWGSQVRPSSYCHQLKVKKYFHFTESQLPPGRDGVEWDSDDGYAEVGNYQVDQQQMIVSSQLKHREGVQCMIQPHIIENEGLLNPVIARHKLQDKDKEFQSKPPFLSRDTGEGCRG